MSARDGAASITDKFGREVLVCSRCGQKIDGFRADYATAGFYDVTGESWWAKYAKPGEKNVCDACMWADPDYIADYGLHLPVPGQLHLGGPDAE